MKHWTERLFIDWARVYSKVLEQHETRMTAEEIQLITKVLDENGIRRGKVLDVPCGTGRFVIELAKRGFQVTGVDFSPHLLEIARKRVRKLGLEKCAALVQGDMRQIDRLLRGQKFCVFLNMFTSLGYYGREFDVNFLKKLKGLADSAALLFIEGQNAEFALSRVESGLPLLNLGPGFEIEEQTRFNSATSTIRGFWFIYDVSGATKSLLAKIPIRLRVYDSRSLGRLVEEAGWKTLKLHHRYLGLPQEKVPARILLIARTSIS